MAGDKSKMAEELAELQLEEAREAADDRKQRRVGRANKSKAIELSLSRDRQHQADIQAGCQHRKGGKGTAQMYSGNDANFAVITHTLSHGPTIVVCQRCGKIWEQPPVLPKKHTAEDRAQYKTLMNEYRRALNFPTDNEPSGTSLFVFTSNADEYAANA
jgi:hypothetical protein